MAEAAGDRDRLERWRAALAERLQPGAGGAPAGGDGAAGTIEEWQGMLIGCSAMQKLRSLVERFAPSDAPVLIRGESGTGKELLARAIHTLSPRAKGPWVTENCAAIPETLLESTLFGHTKGSFTGAVKDHPGHFVAADGGTLFLDEVGDMPLPMQAKLLRVLQEGEVRPVGGSKVRKVDVRVVAATHQDLARMVADGTFREDLMFRLNVLTLEIPPLRDREGDVLALAERLLARAAEGAGRELRFSAAAAEVIAGARWPGNVRQMLNEVQRLVALADGPEVQPDDLSPGLG